MFHHWKYILLAIFTIVIATDAKSQSNGHTITLVGFVSNILTHNPVTGAKVELMTADSMVVDSTTSSSYKVNGLKGGFILKLKKPGEYIIHCTHPDYEESYTPLPIQKIGKHQNFIHDKFCYMQRKYPRTAIEEDNPVELGEVVVKATKVKFYTDKDTLVYNADALNLSEGSMLDDLIRQLPGAEMNDEGEIFVNGRKVEELLLNGRELMGNNRKLILDNLPSFMVNKVKVFEKHTLRQLLDGDTISPKNLAMDINLKRKYAKGWIMNVDGGYGSHERFLAQLFAMRLTENSRVSLYSNINNISDERKPGESSEWTPSLEGNGVRTTRSAGVDYDVEDGRGRYRLMGTLDVSNSTSDVASRTTSEQFIHSGNTYGKAFSNNREHDTHLSLEQYYSLMRPRPLRFDMEPTFNYHHFNNRTEAASTTFTEDQFAQWGKEWMDSISSPTAGSLIRNYAVNRLRNRIYEKGDDWNAGLSLVKVITPNDQRHHIFLSAKLHWEGTKKKQFEHYQLDYIQKEGQDWHNKHNIKSDRGYNHLFGVVESFSVNSTWTISSSYEYAMKSHKSNRSLFLLHKLDGWEGGTVHPLGDLPSTDELMSVRDYGNSYYSTQRDFVHLPTLRIEYNRMTGEKKTNRNGLSLQLPLRIERNELDYRRASTDTLFHRNLSLLEPSISFTSNRGAKLWFSSLYRYTMTAPEMSYLVDVRDDSDPLNIMLGNRHLRNRHNHHFEATLQQTLTGQRMYNVKTLLNAYRNSLALGYDYDEQTGIRTFRPTTVNGNYDAEIAGGLTMPLDSARHFTLQANSTLKYRKSVDMVNQLKSKVGTFNTDQMLKVDYTPSSNVNVGLKCDFHFQHSESRREDFDDINIFDFDYGLTAKLQLPWNIQLSTDLTMYSRRGYADKAVNKDELVWNARVKKTLLHGKLTLVVDGFDILGNISNVKHTVNAQGRTETWTNVIPHYVMFHVVCRLNKQPK